MLPTHIIKELVHAKITHLHAARQWSSTFYGQFYLLLIFLNSWGFGLGVHIYIYIYIYERICVTHCLSCMHTQKLTQNTRKCCLLHATNVRFSNFRGWRRISKSRCARFFYAPNQKKCPIIPRFLPESLLLVLVLVRLCIVWVVPACNSNSQAISRLRSPIYLLSLFLWKYPA